MVTGAGALEGKRVLLGVTGSIAAYKAVELLRRLVEEGAQVRVLMTPAATRFVAPLTFRELSGQPVLTDAFAETAAGLPHVHLAASADLLLIAPATADHIARLATGLADDMVSMAFLATRAPVVLAPAMETNMYLHPNTQAALSRLREIGVRVVEPEEGALASGRAGIGRLAATERILAAARDALGPSLTAGPWRGRRVLVTAGGTQEPLDPVRFLTNRSSGRMGFALAEALLAAGAEVTLLAAATALPPPPGVRLLRVRTALEMRDAVLREAFEHDALFMAAAVADFRPREAARQKIKKEASEGFTLELVRNPDILAEVGKEKEASGRALLLVGFAAETGDLEELARTKLRRKPGVDLLVANDVSRPDAGFEVETNQVTLLTPDGTVERWPLMSKRRVAEALLQWIADRWWSARTPTGSPPG